MVGSRWVGRQVCTGMGCSQVIGTLLFFLVCSSCDDVYDVTITKATAPNTPGAPRPASYTRRRMSVPSPPSAGDMITLQVTLSIQGGGEGGVVECTWCSIMAHIWCHALDAVLRLIRWELTTQDICCDEGLVAGQDSK